ncbi:MAG: UDP-N-acetylmuramoyl-L-alanine--D-glutamate ligase, partial [Patescibacteria group bacterium]
KLTTLCNEYRLAHAGKRLHSLEYVLGQHRGDDVMRAHYVIQNPGVPAHSMFLDIARDHGIPIHNDASIFFSLAQKTPIIGVTGTRGKSTTTSLIAHVLKNRYPRTVAAGMATPAGAISFFSIIDRVLEWERNDDPAPVILELSSWQLELLGRHRFSPRCAVVTNIYPDHLNRYRSMDDYVEAKKNIIRYQKPGDIVVLNGDDPILQTWETDCVSGSTLLWFSKKTRLCAGEKIALPGEHNKQNARATMMVASLWDVSEKEACVTLQSASGVAGRLEHIRTHRGRMFVNDTTATSPDATYAALKTFGGRSKRIILIAGGADKKLVFDELGEYIARSVKALVLLSGTATPLLTSAAAAAGYSGSLDMANSMAEAVGKAWKRSEKDDIILLSPACASFGLFRHEFDRGNQFVDEVAKLCEESPLHS